MKVIYNPKHPQIKLSSAKILGEKGAQRSTYYVLGAVWGSQRRSNIGSLVSEHVTDTRT